MNRLNFINALCLLAVLMLIPAGSIAAPSPPTLSAPANYSIYNGNSTSSITFSWGSVSGALEYWLNIFPSGNSANPKFDGSTSTATSRSVSISSWTSGVYILQVKVRTSAGWSSYSSAREFIVDYPPGPPTLNSPSSGASFNLDSATSFSWSGPSGGTIARYTFRIVRGTDFNQNQIEHTEPSSTSVSRTFSDATYDPGTHTWGVRAIKQVPSGYNQSTYETTVGWGQYATRTFSISAPPPSPPTLSAPANYSIYNGNSTSSITFSWGSVSGALEYWLNVFPSGNSANPKFDGTNSTATSRSVSISSWTSGVYIWQVKVRTSAGWSSYSSAREFIVDYPPGPPTLNSPSSGASFNLDSATTFSWSGPSGGTIARYTFRIVRGTDFNQNQIEHTEPSSTSVSRTFSDATYDPGTHTWGVRAIKQVPSGYNQSTYETTVGWGQYATRTFTLNSSPDFIVTSVTGPSSAAPGQTVAVTISAKNQGPDPTQAGSYVILRLILSPDNQINLADTLYQDLQEPIASWANGATVTRTFSYTIPSSGVLGQYYWGAYVDASYVPSTGQTYWQESDENNNALLGNSIEISSTIAPELLFPANNASVNTNTVNFDWSDVPGAVRYEIIVDNNSGFGSPEIHEPGIHNPTLTESAYPTTNWLDTNVYYWKVIAHFADGTTRSSTTNSFTYQMPTSPSPVWVPFYRFYKGGSKKDHFYTTNALDPGALSHNYAYERMECYISDRNFAGSATLFRLWNPAIESHFYTTSSSEKDNAIALKGYQYEGISGWVFTTDAQGGEPLHRLRQSKVGDYHYFMCVRQSEYQKVLANTAWQFEDNGIAGYVYPAGLRTADAHHKPQGNYGGVDMATRAFRYGPSGYDLALFGGGPEMVFVHNYNSFSTLRTPMGPGWSHNFYTYILEDTDPESGTAHNFVIVNWGDGTETHFQRDGTTNNFKPLNGEYDRLVQIVDSMNYGYDLTTKDQTIYSFRKVSDPTPGSPVPGVRLIWITDRHGNRVSLNWNVDGNLLSVTSSNGHQFLFEYHAGSLSRHVKSVSENALSRSVQFGYDASGRLASFTDARGNLTIYQYDEFDRLAKVVRPEGNTYTIEYNTAGKVMSGLQGTDQTKKFIVSQPAADTSRVTTPKGSTIDFVTANYRLTKLIDSQSQPVDFEYAYTNHPLQPSKVIYREGATGQRKTLQYAYDDNGNTIKITNALGREADYFYDAKNNLKWASDFHLANQTGNRTYYTYDANDNLLTDITNPKGENTHFNFEDIGNNKKLLTWSRDGRGKITTYTYDAHGNMASVVDPAAHATVFHRDNAGRLLWQKDAKEKYTWFAHDNNDNLMETKNHNQFSVFTDWDANNNLDKVRWTWNGQAVVTDYHYNAEDRLDSVTDPLSAVTAFSYHSDGTLKTKTDRLGRTVTYGYDDNAQLSLVTYPGGQNRTINRYPNGLVKEIIGPSGITKFEYTVLDQLSKVTDPFNKVVQYLYDVSDNLWKIIYPDGKAVEYGYDSLGRLETVTDWNQQTTTYRYDESGNLKEILRPNNSYPTGGYVAYQYDNASRLTEIVDKDSAGNIICSHTFVLDPVGNIERVTANEPLTPALPAAVQVNYTHDKANRMLTAGQATFGYDDNNNMISRTTGGQITQYGYDYENMLVSITGPGKAVQYVYDGMNNRIAKTENGLTTRYVLDFSGDMSRVLMETDGSGNVTAYYVYGLGLISRVDAAGNTRYYHFNHRGDTVALTTSQGAVTDAYAYDPYGKLLATSGSTPNSFKFVGQHGVMDEGNNFYFMRARFYDAEIGRFINEDPIGFEGGDWNLFGYVKNNPMMRIDPEGLAVVIANPYRKRNSAQIRRLMKLMEEAAKADQAHIKAENKAERLKLANMALGYACGLSPITALPNKAVNVGFNLYYGYKSGHLKNSIISSGIDITFDVATYGLGKGIESQYKLVKEYKSIKAIWDVEVYIHSVLKDWLKGDLP